MHVGRHKFMGRTAQDLWLLHGGAQDLGPLHGGAQDLGQSCNLIRYVIMLQSNPMLRTFRIWAAQILNVPCGVVICYQRVGLT